MNRNITKSIAALAFSSIVAITAQPSTFAQGSSCPLRVGIIGAANYNYVEAPTQEFIKVPNNTSFASHDFSKSGGFEAYYGIMGEYLFNDLIGAELRATVDARCVSKDDNGSTFTPRLVYVNIEPGVRVNLGMPELHAMAGATVAIKGSAKYDYTPRSGEETQEVTGVKMDNVNDVAYGAWLGFGYDIRLNDRRSDIGWYVTPFVEGNYLFNQKKADVALTEDRNWNTLTGRAGVELKVQF
jgi:hypothetical protein